MTNEDLIRERFPNSRFHEETDEPWEDTHDWIIVEDSLVDNLVVWLDRGLGLPNGLLAVTDGKTVEMGYHSIVTPSIVVLDKDYYGTTKYIWR